MKDKQVELDGVVIPYCEEKGVEWYPIRYVFEQFLLKSFSQQLYTKEEYKQYTKKCVIDYTFKGTVPQETYCMNKKGWIKYLSECKSNKNKDDNKVKRHNIFCDYIGCENKIDEVIEVFNDDYMQYCIEEYLSEHQDIKWQTCVKCNRKFPLANQFYPPDERVADGYTHRCKNCKPSTYPIVCNDSYIRNIYKLLGNDGFVLFKQNMIDFYNKYCHNNSFEFKCGTNNKLEIIKWYYDNNLITEEKLDREYIISNFNFKAHDLNNYQINEYCSNNYCKTRPWKYPKYKIGNLTFEEGKNILDIYIKENNIIIKDILNYDNYENLLKDAKIGQFSRQSHNWNSLKFIVRYYNYEFAGYKYKLKSTNYYKDKESMIFDMKWFIENDLKIPVEKIPLYVTKNSLHTKASQLYNALRNKYYYKTLFEWINDCYPDKFIELDFDINPYRSVFDSLEEAQVDEQIRNRVGNIIHNERNKPNTINIKGMMPDWLICLDNGLWLVEYWGLARKGTNDEKSTNIIYYKNKMTEKKAKYGELLKVGYKHLYIYPEDLLNNFELLHKKLDSIIN